MVISEFYFLTTPLLVKGKIIPSSFCCTGAFVLFFFFFIVIFYFYLFKNFDSAVWLVES